MKMRQLLIVLFSLFFLSVAIPAIGAKKKGVEITTINTFEDIIKKNPFVPSIFTYPPVKNEFKKYSETQHFIDNWEDLNVPLLSQTNDPKNSHYIFYVGYMPGYYLYVDKDDDFLLGQREGEKIQFYGNISDDRFQEFLQNQLNTREDERLWYGMKLTKEICRYNEGFWFPCRDIGKQPFLSKRFPAQDLKKIGPKFKCFQLGQTAYELRQCAYSLDARELKEFPILELEAPRKVIDFAEKAFDKEQIAFVKGNDPYLYRGFAVSATLGEDGGAVSLTFTGTDLWGVESFRDDNFQKGLENFLNTKLSDGFSHLTGEGPDWTIDVNQSKRTIKLQSKTGLQKPPTPKFN